MIGLLEPRMLSHGREVLCRVADARQCRYETREYVNQLRLAANGSIRATGDRGILGE